MAIQLAPPEHPTLDLGIEIERDVAGIEMGVLETGIPYLTQKGLAAMAGVSRAAIFEVSKEWENEHGNPVQDPKTRSGFLKNRLLGRGYDAKQLYIAIERDGSFHYAYPDLVCTAIIEYYAFEATRPNAIATENYRNLAGFGFDQFIFQALKYKPADPWRYYQDRVSLVNDNVPAGYFSVFNEISGLIIDLIQAGLPVNHRTIPDISVGQQWGRVWIADGGDELYGERIRWEHHYPDYYPQSSSNPQHPWAYPDQALPKFRHWLRTTYLPKKFPAYVLKKSKMLREGKAKKIAGIYDQKRISG
ncbi:MAG: hypothetical protein OXH83_03120 [Bryobacterales bacterium]|nr:hypothetical protein [Bryobacterales bacterium]